MLSFWWTALLDKIGRLVSLRYPPLIFFRPYGNSVLRRVVSHGVSIATATSNFSGPR